jgi:hypothetical protein
MNSPQFAGILAGSNAGRAVSAAGWGPLLEATARPGDRRLTEERDELAATHSITRRRP